MKFRMLSLVLLASMAFSAFAAKDIELNGAQANLGNLGDVRNTIDIANNGDYTLVRSEKTADKVEVMLQVQEPQTVCARTQTTAYPCGCYYNGGYYPRPRPGYGYPNPYPYPFPGGYPGGYYGNCGMCQQVSCVEYRTILVTDTKKLKINFKKAETLEVNDQELYDLKIRSNGSSLNYELSAPNQYKVKQMFKTHFKIKNQ
jgi:hypothetical protein